MIFKTLGIEKNFLGIEPEFSTFATSKIVILPAPFEYTTSYGTGAKHGPQAILDSSHYVEFYDEELERELHAELGIATLEPLQLVKRKRGTHPSESALEMIYTTVRQLLEQGKFVVTLGGEHTVSIAPIKAYAERYVEAVGGFSVLHFDAHSDLRESYEGTKFSHACFMARVCEFLSPMRIVQVGIRAQCKEEAQFIRSNGIRTFYAHGIRDGRYNRILTAWEDVVIEKLGENVYVTFDVDCLDPSIMPATGTPEPNGLLWGEVTALLRKLGRRKTIVGFDIVELAPIKGLHHANLTAAKLVYKLLNYSFQPKEKKFYGIQETLS
jgi:agmatinase